MTICTVVTREGLLEEARKKWGTPVELAQLAKKYRCAAYYLSQIMSGKRRTPRWLLVELGYEKVVSVTYRRNNETST